MKNVYIIDEHQSSKQNGIGTYIQQLLLCFRDAEVNVCLLSYNADTETFQIVKKEYYTEFSIPVCGMGGFLQNGCLSLSLLRLYIQDSSENVFFVNHSPCKNFIRTIKKLFPLSLLYFVVHDQGWCAPLLGDFEMLKKIGRGVSRKKWRHILNYTKEEKKMYELSNGIIALSKTTHNIIRDFYRIDAKKIHLIPNGLHLSSFMVNGCSKETERVKLGFKPEEKILLYAGRTVRSKGIYALLKAFNYISSNHKDIRLVIAGQVLNLNEFTALTKDCLSHVCYTGLLSKESLYELYQAADIVILPSYTEQSSYTGIEMLAFGKLSIVARGHSLEDMFADNTAIMVSIKDDRENDDMFASELVKSIERALFMPERERTTMIQNGRSVYERKYTIRQMSQSYIDLINRELS